MKDDDVDIKKISELSDKILNQWSLTDAKQLGLRACTIATEQAIYIADLRNFACNLCGRYKLAHEGACDGCRWKKGE